MNQTCSKQFEQTQAGERRGMDRLAVLDLEVKHGIEKSFAEAFAGIVRDRLHSLAIVSRVH